MKRERERFVFSKKFDLSFMKLYDSIPEGKVSQQGHKTWA